MAFEREMAFYRQDCGGTVAAGSNDLAHNNDLTCDGLMTLKPQEEQEIRGYVTVDMKDGTEHKSQVVTVEPQEEEAKQVVTVDMFRYTEYEKIGDVTENKIVMKDGTEHTITKIGDVPVLVLPMYNLFPVATHRAHCAMLERQGHVQLLQTVQQLVQTVEQLGCTDLVSTDLVSTLETATQTTPNASDQIEISTATSTCHPPSHR